jgi:FkbM family methyltransferase
MILSFLFSDRKVNKINYLDIGTNMPDNCNNTYLFYTRGNYGVCVEADKSLIPLIKQMRPNDIVIHAGVSANEHEADAEFYIFDAKGLNTFDKEEAIKRQSFGTYNILEIDKVRLININSIISEYFNAYPEFLSIDIEGLDLDVLRSLNFDLYPIPVICVETCIYSENHVRPKDISILKFLTDKGYEVYADTYVNTIFINKNWFYNN